MYDIRRAAAWDLAPNERLFIEVNCERYVADERRVVVVDSRHQKATLITGYFYVTSFHIGDAFYVESTRYGLDEHVSAGVLTVKFFMNAIDDPDDFPVVPLPGR